MNTCVNEGKCGLRRKWVDEYLNGCPLLPRPASVCSYYLGPQCLCPRKGNSLPCVYVALLLLSSSPVPSSPFPSPSSCPPVQMSSSGGLEEGMALSFLTLSPHVLLMSVPKAWDGVVRVGGSTGSWRCCGTSLDVPWLPFSGLHRLFQ